VAVNVKASNYRL